MQIKEARQRKWKAGWMVTQEAVAYVLQAVRQCIRDEFKILREDLKRSQGR